MNPVVALLSDFGRRDPYVGMMKMAILEICPGATILDLSHEVEAQGVRQGAFLLAASLPYLPEGTVVAAVVDPGVGTGRRALAARIGGRLLVGPDNGLFSWGWQSVDPRDRAAYELDQDEFWHAPVSDTFHGRDVFAPVAAHLAKGMEIARLGSLLDRIKLLPDLDPTPVAEGMRLRIEHIDRFGNLVTNLAAGDVPSDGDGLKFSVGEAITVGVRRNYDAAERLIAVVGGLGYLELAAPGGSAAALTGAGISDAVIMSSSGD
ncbi:MAG TPA: SAM-dependent chlorinase/fluorinase [Chloroflexota bacterium]|nr:SAM-dependent chlorinase/fluorinase [Chloroflexota bacterium]